MSKAIKGLDLTNANRVIRVLFTRREDRVAILKPKEKLSNSDPLTTGRLLKKLDRLNVEFKEYHFPVNYLLQDDEKKSYCRKRAQRQTD